MAPTSKTLRVDRSRPLGLEGQRHPVSLRPPPLHPLFERRAEPRVRPRLACRIRSRRGIFDGVASQMGAAGLHVDTDADLRPGETVFVVLDSIAASIPERGRIVYRRQAPQSLARVAPSGVGIHLEKPSALYRTLVESLAAAAAGDRDEGPQRAQRR